MDTLGWVYFKKETYDKAIEKLKSAVELSPNSSTIRFHLGMAYYKSNKLANALTEFKNSLAISGRFIEAPKSKEMIKSIEKQLQQAQ
jgi:tetratricopeptide (TPR) repeat protein